MKAKRAVLYQEDKWLSSQGFESYIFRASLVLLCGTGVGERVAIQQFQQGLSRVYDTTRWQTAERKIIDAESLSDAELIRHTEGIAAYGPGDEIELMAAILAAHDEAADEAWRMEVWSPSPLCPICGWELIPVEDGRFICPDCGHEEGGPAGDGEAWAADMECPFCGALLIPGSPGATCPDCGAAFNGAAELAQADDLMAQGERDQDDVVDPAVVADEIAALNRVRFTIEIRTDTIGRPCGATATASDWPGGDQWTL